MARPSKSEIRQERGLSTAQVAKATGVSQRTVQRYEKGESKNLLLNEYYGRMSNANRQARHREKQQRIQASSSAKDINSMTKEELRVALAREGKIAKERYLRIKKNEGKYSYGTDAITKYEEMGHMTKTAGKSRGQLLKDIGAVREFNRMKTSTLKGQKSADENRRLASEATSGMKGRENEVFWHMYNKIKESPETYGYSVTDFYPSDNETTREKIRNEIKEEYGEIYNSYLDLSPMEAADKMLESIELDIMLKKIDKMPRW